MEHNWRRGEEEPGAASDETENKGSSNPKKGKEGGWGYVMGCRFFD